MPRVWVLGVAIACLGLSQAASAADCPRQGALGTSRVLQVKPSEFPLIGKLQYSESLKLGDREVVLTFDDGPSAPYTDNILNTLAAECVKANFFMVGNAVVDAPDIARRAHAEGHVIGTHTFENKQLDEVPAEVAIADIDKGITAVADAIGGRSNVAPFFRAPDFELSKQAERYVLSQGHMVWSADVDGEDWNDISEEDLVARVIAGLEAQGKGIVILRDSQPVVARALPHLIAELKTRKFKIVQVVAVKPPTTTGSAR